ncbi:MAG: efflux RND transporter permease subunit [Gammaproteobacteria bacterium]|nr:efflux RND transporter permease subunit [Gammaproteobacteria bacterium]MCP4090800.1 efflux RND transporter permease subunit [Gammaproteobacteria bacterium]MCP4277227.1 efflux RND transporter permease subunit [Gammaproteobacteria bacterium]MCP4832849.1 efflux RND transporter permease subunit [Gammaproteobacteria bacterium]MCP4928948.1 efflux RND transporter permease subunit [Gammaproteobacteria bacterium]
MLRWFTENKVASNLLMIAIILGGVLSLPLLDREVMPGIPLDMIQVNVDYPGASPAEIEERICIRIEEAIHDLEGIKSIISEAVAGRGGVAIEIAKGFETERMLSDIKARVDALDTLPDEAEEPLIQEAPWSEEVIELVVSADTDETALREIAYRVRDEVARLQGVDEVLIEGLRDPEMAIEVSEHTLQKYNLTFDDVVTAIRRSSINLPGGSIRASGGDISLRTFEQAYSEQDFADIVLLRNADGTRVRLGDVADIRDGFEETDALSRFNGHRAAAIIVRVRNNPDVIAVNEAVRTYAKGARATLPPGVQLDFWLDRSEIFRSRADMLLKSGAMGLALVFLLLTLFLRPAIAIWVCVGIAVSFLGAIFVIPSTPISINMMTLFAFVLVLGIVVDDAIIIGESIHVQVQKGLCGTEAAYVGAQRVAKPVIFAALTTMIAFSPALFIDGGAAKMTMPLSVVVILALAFSLIDAFMILPAHLSNLKPLNDDANSGLLTRARLKVANGLSNFCERRYRPFITRAIKARYLALSIFIAVWLVVMSFVQGGWVKQTFYPLIPGDNIIVSVTLSDGVSFSTTEQVVAQIEHAGEAIRAQFHEELDMDIVKNVRTYARENNIQITMELVHGENRNMPIEQITERWRSEIGFIPDTKAYTFDYHLIDREPPVKLGLTANDPAVLMAATARVEAKLATYDGLFGINNSQRSARTEILVTARDSAENYDVSRDQLAHQVRQGFFGEEVQRIPRGRDEVKVMVRYPKEDRRSLEQINRMRIRVGEDVQIPIGSVAELEFAQGASAIRRLDRRRIVEVTAEADHVAADPHRIVTDIRDNFAPGLIKEFPGLEFLVKGEQDAASEFMLELVRLTLMAFLCTFGLIAIAFRSYIQPAIVMSAVPFGLLGAIIGHLIFGVTMSMFSFMGVVAAAGVVINDNLVLIDRINQVREELGEQVEISQAVIQAAVSRFRPILLTSFTTFIGLLPIMSERSAQSEYLKPMTLSLGFGVAFASFVTLILVPCLYLIVEDARAGFQRLRNRRSVAEVN